MSKWRRVGVRYLSAYVLAVGVASMVSVAVMGVLVFRPGRVHGSGSGGSGGSGCPQVLFIAATGSGEYPSGDNLNPKISPELDTVYLNMVETASSSGASIGVAVVQYSATSVDVLESGYSRLGRGLGTVGAVSAAFYNTLFHAIPEYLLSEDSGVLQLYDRFATERANCPGIRFVLAGYSQGAMVVHDFLKELAASGDSAAQSSIIGVALIADPDRVSQSGVTEFGTASNATNGMCGSPRIAPICATPPVVDLAPMFRSRAISVCNRDDIVCDTSDLVHDFSPAIILGATTLQGVAALGTEVHTSYGFTSQTALAGKLMGRYVAASV